jgi:hypothetical protein
MNKNLNSQLIKKYKLTGEQIEIYIWLTEQNINTDDNTFCYWVKTYPSMRIKEVVNFAITRRNAGQNIRNLGGWIQKFLKTGLAVVDENCKINQEFSIKYMEQRNWRDLKIYEKYVKDIVTGDDLPLTMTVEDFKRSLEILYQKSRLYK